jgi:alkaline phosphatase D
VMMTELRQRNDHNELAYWTDGWDGYPVNRTRLLRHLHERRVRNPVVLSGDIHSYWANDLKLDFADARSPTVATEFVGSSITSRQPFHEQLQKAARDNPHVRFFEGRLRGYATAELTSRVMTTRFRAISSEADPNATAFTLKEFAVFDGRPGVQV